MGLTDEKRVEQINENPYLQFLAGLEAFPYSALFDPSMMVDFRQRLPESVVNVCNKRIVRHGLRIIRSSEADDHDADSSHGGEAAPATDQQLGSETTRPNQGPLRIDATCVPADLRHPADLSLLNESRELTETLIDAMHPQVRECFVHKPRTVRQQARKQFLAVAKNKRPRLNMIRRAIKQQLGHLKCNLASIDAFTDCRASLLAARRSSD